VLNPAVAGGRDTMTSPTRPRHARCAADVARIAGGGCAWRINDPDCVAETNEMNNEFSLPR